MTLSSRHEKHIADLTPGGRLVAGSGSKRQSHDVSTEYSDDDWWQFRYEAKATQKKSYSLKAAEWQRLVEDVYSSDSHERPAWAVRFYGEGGPDDAPVVQDLVVIDLNDLVELLEELGRARKAEQVQTTN